MTGDAFAAARDALAAARRDAHRLPPLPPEARPRDLGAAYALQAAVLATFGGHGAWKVAGVTPAQRATLGVPTAIGAAIPAAFVHDAAAASPSLELGRFIAPLIECEWAFRFGRDLPPRPARAWTRDEVADAIASLHPAIEIVDRRLPPGSGTLAEVADGFNNGALVVGPAVAGWRGLDLGSIAIVLCRVDAAGTTHELARGSAMAILDGDPLGAVVQLANAQPGSGPTLKAGDVVTTGSCTGAPRIPGPGAYRADYAGIGSVGLTISGEATTAPR